MALLDVSDLVKSYRSPTGAVQRVLDVPAFSLDAGEQVALEGQSGTGKTTLLHCIAGILTPDSGTVRVDGDNVVALNEPDRDKFRAERLGYVFQTFNLLQGYTALENVWLGTLFGKKPDRAAARALLERLELGDRLDHRPSQLSIGQQQRVALARALVHKPKLVLADEPTGNLDRRTAQSALGLIREVCGELGAALLLVSHDPTVLDAFDRCESLAEINRASLAGPEGDAA
ncbi:MAG: ABC transporter ATP-binding protein [Planctomycetota bacterium]